MKSIKNIIFSLVIINICIIIGIPKVEALIDGSIGGTSSATYGSAGWDDTAVGVKIIVYDSSMHVKKSGIVVNKGGITANYYTVNNNKFSQSSSYTTSTKPTMKVNTSLPSRYSTNGTFVDFHSRLTSNNYTLLKSLLTSIGANNLSDAKYIVVEPLMYIQDKKYTFIARRISCTQHWYKDKLANDWVRDNPTNGPWTGLELTMKNEENDKYAKCTYTNDPVSINYGSKYFLTAYEFHKMSAPKYNFGCANSGKVYSSLGTCYGPTMSRLSISLGTKTTLSISGTNYLVGRTNWPKANSSNYSSVYKSCITSSTGGCAVGWFAYDDIVPRQTANFKIIKQDDSGNKLAGAVFTLYKGTTAKYTCTSNSNGECNFTGVDYDTYTLKETTVPTGYIAPQNLITGISLTINASSNNKTLGTYTNTQLLNPWIIKEDDSGNKLAGAVFILKQGNREKYRCISVATTGKCQFTGVVPGTYVISEVSAPAGYNKSTETKSVTISKTTASKSLYTFKNIKKPSPWIEKVDQDGKALEGATISLYQGTQKKYTCTSNSSGVCKLSNLEYGKYVIKEDSAPTGYKKSTKEISVTIDANTKNKKLATFTNIKELDIEITKLDDTGKKLKGAKFYLYKDDGSISGSQTIYSCTSDDKGICKFSRVPADGTKYIIRETQAPNGYEKSTQECKFTATSSVKLNCKPFVNDRSCQMLFDEANTDGKVTMEERIQIFRKYSNYKALLNMSNTTAVKACSPYEPTTNDTIGCFSASKGLGQEFSQNNISNYNDVVSFNYNGKTIQGYCLTTAQFLPKIKSSSEVFAGEMLVSTELPATTSILNKRCYLYIVDSSNNITSYNDTQYFPLDYSSYISDVRVSGNNSYLKKSLIEDLREAITSKSGSLYSVKINADYYFPEVYVSNLYGKPVTSPCYNCLYLGKGLLSPLNPIITGGFKFVYKFRGNESQGMCNYKSKPLLITNNKMNLEFRIIDTDVPFPGQTANLENNFRKKGTNWEKMEVFGKSSASIVGNLDSKENIYIKRAVNSYGVIPKTKELRNPKYKIVLNSSDILKIRKYNSTHKYDDYKYDCSTDVCENSFLTELMIGKVDGKKISNSLVVNLSSDEGWKTLNGYKYYFDSNGKKVTGLNEIAKSTYYYFNSDGQMQKGWQEDIINARKKGGKYYFNPNGVMQIGLVKIKGNIYYFDSNGVMQTGKKTINGVQYEFNSNGLCISANCLK